VRRKVVPRDRIHGRLQLPHNSSLAAEAPRRYKGLFPKSGTNASGLIREYVMGVIDMLACLATAQSDTPRQLNRI